MPDSDQTTRGGLTIEKIIEREEEWARECDRFPMQVACGTAAKHRAIAAFLREKYLPDSGIRRLAHLSLQLRSASARFDGQDSSSRLMLHAANTIAGLVDSLRRPEGAP